VPAACGFLGKLTCHWKWRATIIGPSGTLGGKDGRDARRSIASVRSIEIVRQPLEKLFLPPQVPERADISQGEVEAELVFIAH